MAAHSTDSSFVGRDHDLAALLDHLRGGARLCTIAGPGGMGKTRLLAELGRVLSPELGHFCDLSRARSVADVVREVAACLDIAGADETSLVEALQSRGELRLLLDNFEQVACFAPVTLGRWLSRCGALRVVVASREVLRIEGEVRHRLGPLEDDDALKLLSGSTDEALCRDIVQRLEGIPLALELAAGYVSVLGLRGLRERLAQGMLWMRNRRRDAAARHASLGAALAASYEALTEPERRALVACCMFRGSFTLDAAEAVIGSLSDDVSAVDMVLSLRDKSLLFVRRAPACFGIYEMVREHALSVFAAQDHFAEAAARSGALRAEVDGMWFMPLDTAVLDARVDLSRRPALSRVFRTLLAARLEKPPQPLSVEELAKRAWCGERILPRAAAARVYTSIRSLRKLGLGEVLVTREDGYLLHPAVPVEIAESAHNDSELHGFR